MPRVIFALIGAISLATAAGFFAAPRSLAHVHVVANPNHVQELANGQNHPLFGPVDAAGLRNSCAGVLEPANAGPAGYGLETAHHGPDAGNPGKADGCFATRGNPIDGNPAID